MVDVQSDVGGKLIEGGKLLSREIVGNDRLCLRPDIQASDDADCEGGHGIDAPEEKVKESINIPFLPLFEGHFIGEASNRVWYEGWVGDVPDCPAGQNKGSVIFKAYRKIIVKK